MFLKYSSCSKWSERAEICFRKVHSGRKSLSELWHLDVVWLWVFFVCAPEWAFERLGAVVQHFWIIHSCFSAQRQWKPRRLTEKSRAQTTQPYVSFSARLLRCENTRHPHRGLACGSPARSHSRCEYTSLAFIPLAGSLILTSLYFLTLINETSCRYYLPCIHPELMKWYKGSFLYTGGGV